MLRPPRYYRRGPWARLTEGLRYGGGLGQWAWLLHRVTGLGILLYLIIHVIDTFLVVANPEEYDVVIGLYGGMVNGVPNTVLRWAFRLGELGLIASVLFHALNGLRVISFDFIPASTKYQKTYFWAVMILFWAVMLPVTCLVITPLFEAPVAAVTH
ncbi:MAG TPA: succinate dehydrogenase, cytochrome b556 subunit [Isosphaeraceae bacterium]|nr:succinate dehydrogenase, cytochrome b556 subunit [Isosphaeraceae bacterium]